MILVVLNFKIRYLPLNNNLLETEVRNLVADTNRAVKNFYRSIHASFR